jgi:hypothetical protein
MCPRRYMSASDQRDNSGVSDIWEPPPAGEEGRFAFCGTLTDWWRMNPDFFGFPPSGGREIVFKPPLWVCVAHRPGYVRGELRAG